MPQRLALEDSRPLYLVVQRLVWTLDVGRPLDSVPQRLALEDSRPLYLVVQRLVWTLDVGRPLDSVPQRLALEDSRSLYYCSTEAGFGHWMLADH